MDEARERAITLGEIALLLEQQDRIDEALCLQKERLEINVQLDDEEGRAAALADIALIELNKKGQYQEASQHLEESYGLLLRLGRVDAICDVGIWHGAMLTAAGRHEESLEVLRRVRDGCRQLGRTEELRQIKMMIRGTEQLVAKLARKPLDKSQESLVRRAMNRFLSKPRK
ncbi:MAG: tetratricopeptide repeat protein [bacterium]|nr:tetratricopeptide repeat protein [bacterium]